MSGRNGTGATLVIGPARIETAGGFDRVVAEVGGAPAWIESRDTALRPSPEAFAPAFLLPALHHGLKLVVEDAVDPVWLANAAPLQQVFQEWWGYRVRPPRALRGAADAGAPFRPGATALFFSGGVDSFYSLLRGDETPDRLVTVHGLDVAHDDETHMSKVVALSRAVAAERGLPSVIVRTNLRAHPLVAGVPWERSHGGVMAAIGHALGEEVSEVLISSSIVAHRDRAWGSHWQTDPLHSSTRVRFREVGMELRRVEKLRRIAAEPLVQRHLRVCWQNVAGLNCQRCAKCLLTRLVLAECGVLDACATFDGAATLARDLDTLDRYRSTTLRALNELATSPHLDRSLRAAVVRLLERTHHAELPWVRARRALRRRVLGWIGGRA